MDEQKPAPPVPESARTRAFDWYDHAVHKHQMALEKDESDDRRWFDMLEAQTAATLALYLESRYANGELHGRLRGIQDTVTELKSRLVRDNE